MHLNLFVMYLPFDIFAVVIAFHLFGTICTFRSGEVFFFLVRG